MRITHKERQKNLYFKHIRVHRYIEFVGDCLCIALLVSCVLFLIALFTASISQQSVFTARQTTGKSRAASYRSRSCEMMYAWEKKARGMRAQPKEREC